MAKYFAIVPAIFAATYPELGVLNVMRLSTPASAVLAAVIVSTRRPSGSGTANLPEAQPVVGHIFDIVGLVEIAADELPGTPATDGIPVRSGEAVLTKGADSHVSIRLDDGTVISLAGDTRVTFPVEDRNRLTSSTAT
jgi:hypothetical protein